MVQAGGVLLPRRCDVKSLPRKGKTATGTCPIPGFERVLFATDIIWDLPEPAEPPPADVVAANLAGIEPGLAQAVLAEVTRTGKAANQSKARRGVTAMVRVCGSCGKSFTRWPSEIKRGQGTLCSNKCAGAAKSKREERRCEGCGAAFTAKPAAVARGQGRFCSRRCAYAAASKSTEISCEVCGKKRSLRPSQVKPGHGRFCSKKCRAADRSTYRNGTSAVGGR